MRTHEIDTHLAISVCGEAAYRNPDTPRFKYQLSRALNAAGNSGAAYALLREAAKEGYAAAQYSMGNLGLAGISVGGDVPDAEFWLKRAAEQGLPRAQADLGVLYFSGRLGAPDAKVAYDWLDKAAASGSLYARTARQTTLFLDAERNADRSAGQKAYGEIVSIADAGGIDAMLFLARALSEGWGGPPNIEESVRWYEVAANAGNAEAQRELAHAYEIGVGRSRNYELARYWYQRAVDGGDVPARLYLRLLSEQR